MSFPGAFTTYSTIDTALNDGQAVRVRDIEAVVHWRNRNTAEFAKFLNAARSGAKPGQVKHEWVETDKAPNFLIVKGACNSSAKSIDVFDAYQAVAGETFINDRTDEIIRIDAVDDADTVSTEATTGYGRGADGSTAAAMQIGDRLIKMGNTLAEEGTAADSRGVTPTELWNYLEGFQKTWQVTQMQQDSVMLDGVGQIDEAYMRSLWEMDEEVNAALWFSRRNRVVRADGTLYTMNGFDQQVKTHAIDLSNVVAPTWEVFNERFSPAFDANASSGEKNVFCGQAAYNGLVAAARAVGIREENLETLWGTEVMVLRVDGGTLNVIKDYRTFKGALSGSARVVDPAHVEYLPFWPRVVIPNVQNRNQPTVRKDMAMLAGTLVVRHEDCHMRVDGLGGSAFANVR